jgi:hypothetical protein
MALYRREPVSGSDSMLRLLFLSASGVANRMALARRLARLPTEPNPASVEG